jgi:hypothetical protein
MWCLRNNRNTLLRSLFCLPRRWMLQNVKTNGIDAWKNGKRTNSPSLNFYRHTSYVATTQCSLSPAARGRPSLVSSRPLLPLFQRPSKLLSATPSIVRWFSDERLEVIKKYLKRRVKEKMRKLRLAKASGKKPPIKITSSMKKYKKQRKYYIMELLRRQMMQERLPKVTSAPQLPILFPYRQYEMIPRPPRLRKRQRPTLRQKVYSRLYDLQQDRLAQKNPLHSQCRTCPVCQRRFVEGRQKMLHHLFHYLPCSRTLPVETLHALVAQKEFADRYEELQQPIKFKTKKQFR